MFNKLIPTMLVGSYPQPGWLVDTVKLRNAGPARVPMHEIWKPASDELDSAKDDAVVLTINDQERAGVDIIGDGEVRRESYFNHFANALDGIDTSDPAIVPGRTGKPTPVPRVTGPIRRSKPVQVQDVAFLRARTDRPIKVTIPGAFTMARLAVDEYYQDQEALIFAYADALNAEIRDLKAAGADLVQIDEPYLQANPEDAERFGVTAIDRALANIKGPTAVHLCFGYAYVVDNKPSGYSFLPQLNACSADAISIEAAQPGLDPVVLSGLPDKQIIYGVLDLGAATAETPELVADRLRGALAHVSPDRLIAAPDCGMKYLPRDLAYAKMQAMVAGAEIVRAEI